MVEVQQHSVNYKPKHEPEGRLQDSSEAWGHRAAFAEWNMQSTVAYSRFVFARVMAIYAISGSR